MATTYDKASLVMIPSGVKEDKLYSIKPTDGSGDFTFSRGSDIEATRVNSSGNIEKAKVNNLLQSNQFDTTWAVAFVNTNGGQSGYDGSTDAWEFEVTATGSARRVQQSISLNGILTYSVYAKAGTTNWVVLQLAAASNHIAYFDLQNGVVGTETNLIESNIESVGGGWYRCSITANTSSLTTAQIFITDGDGTSSVTSGANIYIQDAALCHGLVAQDYVETTTTAVVEGLTADLPRLDYSGGASCPSLLLEPSRSNLLEYSEYLDATPFKSRVNITNNAVVSPEGVQNAAKVIPTSLSGTHALDYVTSVVVSDYTMSVYAKAGEYSKFLLLTNNRGSNEAIGFDLSDASTFVNDLGYATPSADEVSIEAVGNDWYRCSMKYAKNSTGGSGNGIYLVNDAGASTFVGNNSDGIYFWGWQMEAGSYPTSYIPTYGTAANRGADDCEKTGISSLIGQTEGTLFYEFNSPISTPSSNQFLSVNDGTSTNRMLIGPSAAGDTIRVVVIFSGVSNGGDNYSITDLTADNKIAVKYTASSVDVFINGVKQTSQSGGVFSSSLNVITNQGGANSLYVDMKQLLTFKTALTDAECIALTTI